MRLQQDENGMTLIELIISIALLGIILGPMFGAFLLALNTNNTTGQRVADSAGAQVTSSWFSSDVQSSDAVRTSSFTCGSAPTTLVEFGWTDADPLIATVTDVTYDILSDGDPVSPEYRLVRRTYVVTGGVCSGSPRQTTMVQAVLPTSDPVSPPNVSCVPLCNATATTVSMRITAQSKKVSSNSFYSAFTLTMTGTRRVA